MNIPINSFILPEMPYYEDYVKCPHCGGLFKSGRDTELGEHVEECPENDYA